MIIHESLIDLHLMSKDRREIIEDLARRAGELGRVRDIAGYIEAVFEREEIFPTVIGYGIAIPYGKSSCVRSPFIAFARSEKPFRWDSRAEQEARLIFLIGVPEEQDNDLDFKLLIRMSESLTNEYYREKLLKATDAGEVVEIFRKMGW